MAILLALGQGTGHRLPEDSINAGIFEDKATNSLNFNEVARISHRAYACSSRRRERYQVGGERPDGRRQSGSQMATL